VRDNEIDEVLERAAETPYEVDPALLSRVSASMAASLKPVRPIPPLWIPVGALLSILVMVAILDAWSIGFYGLQKLSSLQVGFIFIELGIFSCLAALMSVGEMTPGSRRWINPGIWLVVVLAGWIAVDAMLFRDYEMGSFVSEGIPCLRAGTIAAVPAGIGSWLVLRRGFAVRPVEAGLAAGTLAGLAGLTMLELHCPNFHAMHVMVWHTAVVPVGAVAGAVIGGCLPRFKSTAG
jgi:hypothetical protein